MRISQEPDGLVSVPDADAALLERFATAGDEAAFAELARRHSGLIYSLALRRGGSPELAQEATQNVLAALARKAARLAATRHLTPWLHRAALLETTALLRREARYRDALRRRQEDTATAMPDPAFSETAAAWASVRPLVDEELDALSARDREVLLWHHVEGRTFRDIAARLGVTAEAAQRRGHRALEKLAARLRRRGVTVPALVLGGALTTGLASEAAAAAVSSTTLATTALAHGRTLAAAARTGTPWVASPAALVAAGVLSAGLPVWWQVRAASRTNLPPAAEMSSRPHGAPLGEYHQEAPAPKLPQETKLAYLRQAIEQLKKTAPDAAPSKLSLQLRKYLLTLDAEEAPQVGEWLRGAPDQHMEMKALVSAYIARLAEVDPQLMVEVFVGKDDAPPDQAKSDWAIDPPAVLAMLVETRPAEAVELLKDDENAYAFMTMHQAKKEPAAALRQFAELSQKHPGKYSIAPVLAGWLLRSPEEAVRWVDQHAAEQPEVGKLLGSLFPGGLGDWVARQMPADKAVALTASLDDPLVRNHAIKAMYRAYARTQPEALTGLAPFLRLEDRGQPLSVAQVVTAWRKKDETGVRAWVESLPESDLKTTAHRHLAAPTPTPEN